MDHNEHEYMHEHNIPHTHDHEQEHEHDHAYMHEHNIPHTHEHGHDHESCPGQEGCGHDCGACPSADPKAEIVALMKYMVGHNAAHANELAQLAEKLRAAGETVAAEQVLSAVSDFEKGNMRLSTVLAALNA